MRCAVHTYYTCRKASTWLAVLCALRFFFFFLDCAFRLIRWVSDFWIFFLSTIISPKGHSQSHGETVLLGPFFSFSFSFSFWIDIFKKKIILYQMILYHSYENSINKRYMYKNNYSLTHIFQLWVFTCNHHTPLVRWSLHKYKYLWSVG